ncbi:hypothetical protein MVEN_01857500 [Mycena venus]|uniref:Cytochrome P450 n=1 Tax=Mycena venus TaxID=2733690 RepID=A0A8H6XIP1_9AGAR|nr:hypothetical protein MVEN_01857500 [Mycena venus]
MAFIVELVLSLFGTLAFYALYEVLKAFYRDFSSPVRNLPGPKSAHWFSGNRSQFWQPFEIGQERRWAEQYGTTFRINGFLGASANSNDCDGDTDATLFVGQPTYHLGRVVGPGVLVLEEDVHKKQRRIMNPAFGIPALRDIWAAKAAQSGGVARVEVRSWFNKATLDIIGEAGFKYDFHSLSSDSDDGPRDELHEALTTISGIGDISGMLDFLKAYVPFLRLLRTKVDTVIEHAQGDMRRIGQQLLRESRQGACGGESADSGRSRDLLSLLVRANMAKDIPENQRLSDEEVLAQVPTFFVAGHETTSDSATWALFSLAANVDVQNRLRKEILTVETDDPTMDELNALPYLDAVVRETLRCHAPVVQIQRVAMRDDDVIPLSKPYTDRNGVIHDKISLRKGQSVMLPLLAMNHDPTIWGTDAKQFKPERWERDPPISTSLPGIWGQMMTFLGGPRACIGYRFSLVEYEEPDPITSTSSSTHSVSVPPQASNIKKKRSLAGPIGGGVVGGIVVLCALVVLVYWARRRRVSGATAVVFPDGLDSAEEKQPAPWPSQRDSAPIT